MKIIMYGAGNCPDCVEAGKQLRNDSDIELDYRNITESTSILKEFLAYRDHEDLFSGIKAEGKIGIPFFILEDGTMTLELADIYDNNNPESFHTSSACSIDGKGHC